VAEARQYQQKGDFPAAIIQLKNALQKNPDDAEARLLLGTVYNEAGDPQSAEKELRRAQDLRMSPAKVLPQLGQTLLVQGKFEQVLDETKQFAGAQAPAEILSLRGNAYLALGKAKEAKAAFEQALQNQPDAPEALIGLAKHALTEGNIEAASSLSEQAVSKNPNSAHAWLFKADLLRAQGKIEASLAAYDQTLKHRQKEIRCGQGRYRRRPQSVAEGPDGVLFPGPAGFPPKQPCRCMGIPATDTACSAAT
jgi:Tfp pilus assembly protein PilF